MKAVLLDTLKKCSELPNRKLWRPETFHFLNDLPGLIGASLRGRQGAPYEDPTLLYSYPFDEGKFLDLVDLVPYFSLQGKCEASEDELFNCQLSDGQRVVTVFSPLINGKLYFGEIILVIDPITLPGLSEWALFCDSMARIIGQKYFEKPLVPFSPGYVENFHDLDFFISIHRQWSQIEGFEAQGTIECLNEYWFEEDASYLGRFLSCLQSRLNLETVFVIQRVSTAQTHLIVASGINSCEKLPDEVKDTFDDLLIHESFGTLSTVKVKVFKTLFAHPSDEGISLSCLSFICEALGVHFGILGCYIRKGTDIRHISKFMTVLANHLAFRFAHLFQLRKEKTRRIFFQNISSFGNSIAIDNEIEPILEKLIQTLGSIFGLRSGAIFLIPPGQVQIEVVRPFGEIPYDFKFSMAANSPDFHGAFHDHILEARFIKKAGDFETPIRYIIPFRPVSPSEEDRKTLMFQNSLGSLVLFESPENPFLDDEAFEMLMILLNTACIALLAAWNYQSKLQTIQAIVGLLNKLSEKKTMLEEMVGLIQRFLKVKCCSLLTMSPEENVLILEEHVGLPSSALLNYRFPVGEGISGYVAGLGATLRTHSVETDPRLKHLIKETYFKGPLLSVPLISTSQPDQVRVIGVINVCEKVNGLAFSDQDQILLETIAKLPAVALENSQLSKAKRSQELLNVQLNAAREVQTGFLPKSFNMLPPNVKFFGKSEPARRIGGDFFDINILEDGCCLITIGDVSGKDMPAALLMVAALIIQRTVTHSSFELEEILNRINEILRKMIDDYHFVTLMLVKVDPKTGRTNMISAGHGPLLAIIDGKLSEISSPSGAPLGVLRNSESRFKSVSFNLFENDILLFYTDGLTDQRSPAGEMFGNERLKSLFFSCREEPTQQIVEKIFSASNDWRSNEDLSDDMTVLALKFMGNSNLYCFPKVNT